MARSRQVTGTGKEAGNYEHELDQKPGDTTREVEELTSNTAGACFSHKLRLIEQERVLLLPSMTDLCQLSPASKRTQGRCHVYQEASAFNGVLKEKGKPTTVQELQGQPTTPHGLQMGNMNWVERGG